MHKDDYQDPWATEKDPNEGKSLKDMLREKREQNEKNTVVAEAK